MLRGQTGNSSMLLTIYRFEVCMKRLFLVLLSTCLIASCNSPEDKAEDFFEDMMEALEEQDFDEVLNVFCEYDDWYNTLSESEQQEFDEAL